MARQVRNEELERVGFLVEREARGLLSHVPALRELLDASGLTGRAVTHRGD